MRLSKHLAAHLSDFNVNVNAILPGAFRSRMMRATLAAAEEQVASVIVRDQDKLRLRLGMMLAPVLMVISRDMFLCTDRRQYSAWPLGECARHGR